MAKNNTHREDYDAKAPKEQSKEKNTAYKKDANKGRNQNDNRNNKGNSNGRGDGKRPQSSNNGHAYNDVQWYSQNAQLLRDSASIPFPYATGSKLDYLAEEGLVAGSFLDPVTGMEVSRATIKSLNKSKPGVCAIGVGMGCGYSEDNTSPVNIAARLYYTFIRHANSGSANYNAPDLMLYTLALDSMYAYLAFLRRAYGVITTYSSNNRYMPRAYIEAMGLDFDDLMANLANFRYWINVFTSKIGSMATPSDLYINTRHAWMFSNIYSDDVNAIKSQAYIFVPEYFFKYQGYVDREGGMLIEWQWDPTVAHTLQDVIDFGNELIDPVIYDEDMNIMSGDILKAFKGKVATLLNTPEDYKVLPVYVPEVLLQIQNSTLVGTFNFEINQGIHQDQDVPGAPLIYRPSFSINMDPSTTRTMLNSPVESPEPDIVMVMSRLTANGADVTASGNDYTVRYTNIGSEVVTRMWLLSYGTVLPTSEDWRIIRREVTRFYNFGAIADGSATISSDVIQNMATLRSFSYAPMVVPYTTSTITSDGVPSMFDINIAAPLVDLQNVAFISDSTLAAMHATALLSMYAVPSMGEWSTALTKKS